MNYYSLLLGGSLLLASPAYAQFGLRAGANTMDFRLTGTRVFTPSTSKRLGYQAGIYYQLPLSKRLTLVPEVQYSRERLTYTQTNYTLSYYLPAPDRQYSLWLSYLNVPVLLRVTVGPVYLEAGPQASMLLGGRQEGFTRVRDVTTGTITSTTIDGPVTDRFRRFDVGPCLGLGVNLPAGLGVNLRAYQGVVSLTQGTEEAEAGSARRQTVQVALTYQVRGRS
jgi:hypothetical protein